MILAGTENDEEIWVRDCYEHPVEDKMKCEQHLERGILVDVCFCSDDLCNSMMGTIPTQTSTPTSTTSVISFLLIEHLANALSIGANILSVNV